MLKQILWTPGSFILGQIVYKYKVIPNCSIRDPCSSKFKRGVHALGIFAWFALLNVSHACLFSFSIFNRKWVWTCLIKDEICFKSRTIFVYYPCPYSDRVIAAWLMNDLLKTPLQQVHPQVPLCCSILLEFLPIICIEFHRWKSQSILWLPQEAPRCTFAASSSGGVARRDWAAIA